MTVDQKKSAHQRAQQRSERHQELRSKLVKQAASQANIRPMTPLCMMAALARILPDDIAVIEEAVTTTNTVFERLGVLKNTTGYFGHRGWTLGWGLGCSIGAKLAWPDRPVLALLGEGAALYGITGLWSAARHRLPVVFVICNNAQYQILKIGAKGLQLPYALRNEFVALDLVEPEIDFVQLAKSLGVEALRISEPDELAECVRSSFRREAPLLIDVPIARNTQDRLNYG